MTFANLALAQPGGRRGAGRGGWRRSLSAGNPNNTGVYVYIQSTTGSKKVYIYTGELGNPPKEKAARKVAGGLPPRSPEPGHL